MSSGKERKIGVVLSYLNIGLIMLIMLAYTPFVLGQLGQSEYGLYSLAVSILGYLLILDMGLGNSVIVFNSKLIAKGDKENEKILHGSIFGMYLGISIVSLVAIGVLYFNVDAFFEKGLASEELAKLKIMILILMVNVFFHFPLSIYSSILQAYEKFVFTRSINLLKSILGPVVLTPVLLLGYKSVSAVFVLCLVNLLCLFLNYFYAKKTLTIKVSIFNFKSKTLKQVFSLSFFVFLALIVDQVNWQSGQLIIAANLGSGQVSIYALAVLFNSALIMFATAISGVMLPKTTKLIALNTNTEVLTDEMIKIGRLQFYIVFFVISGFIIFGKEFITQWVGSDYQDVYLVSLWCMLPLAIPLIQNLGISILQAMQRFAFRALSALIGAVVTIFISISVVEQYGYYGVAAATGIMLFVINGLVINFYYHYAIKLNMKRFWLSESKQIIPLTLLLIVFFYFYKLIPLGSMQFLYLGVPLYTAVYSLISYLFIMNEYEKNIVKSIFKVMKSTLVKLIKR